MKHKLRFKMKYFNLIAICFCYCSCASFSLEFILQDHYYKKNLTHSSIEGWQKIQILSQKPQKNIKIYGKIVIRKFNISSNSTKLKNYLKKKIYQKGLDGVFFVKIKEEKIDKFDIQRINEDRQRVSYRFKQKIKIITGFVYRYVK